MVDLYGYNIIAYKEVSLYSNFINAWIVATLLWPSAGVKPNTWKK
jgi:hypothetical protein